MYKKRFTLLFLCIFSPSAFAVTNAEVFAYAAANYPSLFSGATADGQSPPYSYRFYAGTQTYLGLDTNGGIYIMGPYTNYAITVVGTAASFAPAITAWETTRNTPTPIQALVSSGGDRSKYVGSWHSCTLQTNGQFRGNNISFSFDGTDLFFEPAFGIVGNYYDAACTRPAQVIAISAVAPLRITPIATITIVFQPGSRFSGTADQPAKLGDPVPNFVGFSSDYKSLWFSSTNAFDSGIVRYDKLN